MGLLAGWIGEWMSIKNSEAPEQALGQGWILIPTTLGGALVGFLGTISIPFLIEKFKKYHATRNGPHIDERGVLLR